jgi:hypothetical protein
MHVPFREVRDKKNLVRQRLWLARAHDGAQPHPRGH